jgi:hydrogenase nickel incorporation protein HypA/HybF
MHELSLCEQLVDLTLDEYRKLDPPPMRLVRVSVVVGRMRRIVPESLRLAYEILSQGTPLAGSALDLQDRPVTGRCQTCGWRGAIEESVFLCPDCGSANLEVISGMELYLDCLEVEQDDSSQVEGLPGPDRDQRTMGRQVPPRS